MKMIRLECRGDYPELWVRADAVEAVQDDGVQDGRFVSRVILRSGTSARPVWGSSAEIVARLDPPDRYEPVILGDPKWPSIGHAIQAYFEFRERLILPDLQAKIDALKEIR